MESRVVPSEVRWINPAGGDWSVAANWDTGTLPGPNDDVIIDMPGNPAITRLNIYGSVHSLNSQDRLVLDHSSLGMEAASTFGDLDILTGTLTGSGNITVSGRLRWVYGSITSSVNGSDHPWLAANGGVDITGNGFKLLESRDLDIHQSGRIQGPGYIGLHNARLTNYAGSTLQLSGVTFSESAAWSAFITNEGEILTNGNVTLGASYITNAGSIEVEQGSLTISRDTARIANAGSVMLDDASSSLRIHGETYSQTGSVTGAGNVRVDVSSANIQGGLQVQGDVTLLGGRIDVGVQDLFATGTLNFGSGFFTVMSRSIQAGAITIDSPTYGTEIFTRTAITIAGSLNLYGGNTSFNSATVQADSVFIEYGGGGSFFNSAITSRSFLNQGGVVFSGSTVLTVAEGFDNRGVSSVDGTGVVIEGDFLNEGYFLFYGQSHFGQLTVTGNYTQTFSGTLRLAIGGSSDLLVVKGVACLDGTVEILLALGYQEVDGDTFHVIAAKSVSGDFWRFSLINFHHGFSAGGYSDGLNYFLEVRGGN